jgi:hypothetical protein
MRVSEHRRVKRALKLSHYVIRRDLGRRLQSIRQLNVGIVYANPVGNVVLRGI